MIYDFVIYIFDESDISVYFTLSHTYRTFNSSNSSIIFNVEFYNIRTFAKYFFKIWKNII